MSGNGRLDRQSPERWNPRGKGRRLRWDETPWEEEQAQRLGAERRSGGKPRRRWKPDVELDEYDEDESTD